MSLRLRLTLVSVVVLMVVLTSFGGGVYLLLNKTLHDTLDAELLRQAGEVIADLPSVEGRPGLVTQIVGPTGNRLNVGPEGFDLAITPQVLAIASGESSRRFYEDITLNTVELRLIVEPIRSGTFRPGAVMVAAPRGQISVTLGRLRLLLVWASVVGLAVAAILAWQAAKTALRPVEDVAVAAGEIGRTGDLSRRVDLAGVDELGRLTAAFNEMMDRLEQAQDELARTIEGQRRFLADASHELRTPLTTMRGNLEVMRTSHRLSKQDLAEAMRDSIEEAERMSRLVEDLLALARNDAQAPRPSDPVRLAAIAREAVAIAAGVDEASGGDGPTVSLTVADDVVVQGSADLLLRLVTNLVENAMKYTPAEGTIDVSVSRETGWAVLQVSDTGIGMSEDELAHAFDRFWRSDRSRSERGSGLGLAIAKSVAQEHGGAIAATSTPGEGTTMTVRLPAAQGDSETA